MPAGAKPWLKGRKKKQLQSSNFVKAPLAAPQPVTAKTGNTKDVLPDSNTGRKTKPTQQLVPEKHAKRQHRPGTSATATVAAAAAGGDSCAGAVTTRRADAASDDGAEGDSDVEAESDLEHRDADEDGSLPPPEALAGLERVSIATLRQAQSKGGVNGEGGNQDSRWRNKEKVLMLSSRGIPPRHRHLMLDLLQLIPGGKRDSKLDTKSDRAVINEAAELKGCTSALFFEARKRKDCYLWAAKVPAGPTAKFLIVNVHTMAELKLSGNHLKGSRPVLSFDQTFDSEPHWVLLKSILSQMFTTPKRHHKSKPFFDHVITFCVADGRIWLRNYQVCPAVEKAKDVTGDSGLANLVEVGPRACLNPILIFSGAFGGPVIWENPGYVSPNDLRAASKRQEASKYSNKVAKRAARRVHKAENAIPKGDLDDLFR